MARKRSQIINNKYALEQQRRIILQRNEELVQASLRDNSDWLDQLGIKKEEALYKFLGGYSATTTTGEVVETPTDYGAVFSVKRDVATEHFNLAPALLDHNRIQEVITNSTYIAASKESLTPYEVERKPPKYAKNKQIQGVYETLAKEPNFFDSLLSGKSMQISLDWENIPGYQTHQTSLQAQQAINKIKQDKSFITWDLETTAGKNVGEQNEAARITEFSFAKNDMSKPEGERLTRFNAIIGSTEKEYQEDLALIRKFQTGGVTLSNEELVNAQRLALEGNRKTSYKIGEDGVHRYVTFAGAEDVSNLDYMDMLRGAEIRKKIGDEQRAAGAAVTNLYSGEKVYAWEDELLQGLKPVLTGESTAVGFNSRTFDINRLNQFVSSGRLSEGAVRAIKKMTGGTTTISFDNHLDVLPIFREKFDKDWYTAADYKYMQENGLTEFQQETLVRKFTSNTGELAGKTFYEGENVAAHMAMTDVEALTQLVEHSVLDPDKGDIYSYGDTSQAKKISGKQNQVFMSKKWFDPNRYDLLTVTRDGLSGALRFGDKMTIDESGVREELFGQTGLQRGVTYELKNLTANAIPENIKQEISKLYPQLALDELVVAEFQTYDPTGRLNTPKGQSSIYYLGYRENLENAFMDNLYHLGHLEDGQLIDEMSEATRADLSLTKQDADGRLVTRQADLEQIVKQSAQRAQEESAGRYVRSRDYTRDFKLLNLMQALDSYVATNGGTRSEAEQIFFDNSVKVSKQLMSGPLSAEYLNSPEYINSYNKYLGYTGELKPDTERTEGLLYSETLGSQRARLNWGYNNRGILQTVHDLVKDYKDKDTRQYAYQTIMQGLEDRARIINPENMGQTAIESFAYEFQNKFDINLRGFKGIQDDKIVTLSLDSFAGTAVNQIIRAGNLGDVSDYTEDSKARLLRDLQTFLEKRHRIEIREGTHIEAGDPLNLAGKKFLDALSDTRILHADNPAKSGHLIDPETVLMKNLSKTTLNTAPNFGFGEKYTQIAQELANDIPYKFQIFKLKGEAETAKSAADFASKMLYDEADIDKLKDLDIGYSEEELGRLRKTTKLLQQNVNEYLQDLFKGIGELGGSLAINPDTKTVTATIGSENFVLELPTGTLKGGQYQTKIGNMFVSAPVGIYDIREFGAEKANLEYMTSIGAAYRKNKGLLNWHIREAKRNGQSMYHVQKAIGDINQLIRQSPVVKSFGEVQRANQLLFDYADLFKNIDALSWDFSDTKSETGDYQKLLKRVGGSELHFNTIKNLAEGKIKFDVDHPKMEHVNALDIAWDMIFDKYLEYNQRSSAEVKEAIDSLYLDTKMSGRMKGYMTSVGNPFLQMTHTKRGGYAIEEASRIDVTEFKQRQAESEVLAHVKIGSGITSEAQDKMATYADELVDSEGRAIETHNKFRMGGLHFNRAGLAATVNYGLDELAKKATTQQEITELAASSNMLRAMFAEEGSAFIHGEIFDRLMHVRDSDQKVYLHKIVEADGERLYEIEQKYKSVPEFSINYETGKIDFKYGTGVWVAEGDVIAHVPGMYEGGQSKAQKAKYSGILNFGFFDAEGHVIKQERIKDLIQNDSEISTILMNRSLSADERSRRALSYLQSKFTAAYFVSSDAANSLVKTTEFTEKGMAQALISGTGKIDKRIHNIMERLGFSGNLAYTDSNGKVKALANVGALEIDLIDSLRETDLLKTQFGVAAAGRYQRLNDGKQLTEEALQGIIKNEFASVGEFQKAIMAERYTQSRVFDKILRKVDFGGKTLLRDDQYWGIIANHAENIVKHKELTTYRALVNAVTNEAGVSVARDLVADYMLPSEFREAVTKAQQEGLSREEALDKFIKIKDDRLLFTDAGLKYMDKLEYGRLQKALSDSQFKLKTGDAFKNEVSYQVQQDNGPVNIIMQHDIVEGSREGNYWDREKTTTDAVRMNQRAITIAENVRYGELGKENVRRFLEINNQASGTDTFNRWIAGAEEGSVVNLGAVDQIKRNIFNRAGGGEKISGFMNENPTEDLRWGVNRSTLETMVREEGIGNGNIEQGMDIMQRMLTGFKERMGITTVNREGAINAYRAFSATAAQAFNINQSSVQDLLNIGFEIKTLDQLNFDDTGLDSVFGKNILVDLNVGDKYGGLGDRLYQGIESQRYIALSYNPTNEEDAILSSPQQKIKLLRDRLSGYESDLHPIDSETMSFQEQERNIQKLQNIVQSARGAVADTAESKTGVMADFLRAHMHGASRQTAKGMEILGIEKNRNADVLQAMEDLGVTGLEKLEIAGYNLVEEARKGSHGLALNYTILSKERMHDIYDRQFEELRNAFKSTGDTSWVDQLQQQTYEELTTRGTHGISAREPMQYWGSVQQRQIFFSDVADANMAIGNFTGAVMRKEDWDSDAVVNAIHKEQAAIKVNGQVINAELDSATINVLQRMSASGNLDISVNLLDEGAQERLDSYTRSQIYLGAGEAQRYRNLIDWGKQQAPDMNYLDLPDINTEEGLKAAQKRYDGLIIDGTGNSKIYRAQMSIGNINILRDAYYKAESALAAQDLNFVNLSGDEKRKQLLTYQSNLLKSGHTEEAQTVMDALRFSVVDQTLKSDLVSRTAQPYGAGIVNHYTQTYLNIANEVLNSKGAMNYFRKQGIDVGKMTQQISLVSTAVQEGFLSPKNNAGEVDTTHLQRAYRKAFALSDNASVAERNTVRKQLKDVIWGVVSERTDKEVRTLPRIIADDGTLGKFAKDDPKLMEEAEKAVDTYVNFLIDHVSNKGNSPDVMGFASRGARGYNPNASVTYAQGSSRLVDQTLGVFNEVAKQTNSQIARERPVETYRKTNALQQNEVERSEVRAQEERIERAKIIQESAKASTERGMQIIKGGGSRGSSILAATVGIAAGLMTAGFAHDPSQRTVPREQPFGNAPIPNTTQPEPALTQAADGAAYAAPPPMLPLTDSNLNVMRGGPHKAYVINVSGHSSEGQQQTLDAMNAAINGPVPQNTSINVAVNNNYQDTLNQYQLNRMVQTAVGW